MKKRIQLKNPCSRWVTGIRSALWRELHVKFHSVPYDEVNGEFIFEGIHSSFCLLIPLPRLFLCYILDSFPILFSISPFHVFTFFLSPFNSHLFSIYSPCLTTSAVWHPLYHFLISSCLLLLFNSSSFPHFSHTYLFICLFMCLFIYLTHLHPQDCMFTQILLSIISFLLKKVQVVPKSLFRFLLHAVYWQTLAHFWIKKKKVQ